jgi:ketosteroid isomerase-like protein
MNAIKEDAMRTFYIAMGLVIGLCLTVQTPLAAGNDTEKIRETLEKTSAILVKATIENDLDTIMSYYLDDVITMPAYHPMLKGKEALRKREEESRKKGYSIDSLNFTILEVHSCEDTVYEIGLYAISMTIPGRERPFADKGKYVTLWKIQDDGSLKIKAEIWNSDINPWQSDD